VALGVALLLLLWGTAVHLLDRDQRTGWIAATGTETPAAQAAADGSVVLMENDLAYFGLEEIMVVRIATAQGSTVALPEGMPALNAGETLFSPAVLELAQSVPSDQFADRFGDTAGEIPASMLKGPSHRVVIQAVEWDQLASSDQARVVEVLDGPARSESVAYQVLLAIGGVSLLVPIMLFIAIVSQWGAAQRREVFETLTLMGAGPRSLARLAAMEMAAVGVVGGILGAALAWLVRPAVAMVPIAGSTLYTSDVTAPVGAVVGTIVGVTVLGAVTAWVRATRSPALSLGAVKDIPESRVRVWRLLPLLLGVGGMMLCTLGMNLPFMSVELASFGVIGAFFFTVVGLVVAGPWATLAVSRLLRKRASGAVGVVAAARIVRHPRSTFRAVAGFVVAVYVVTVFAGGASVVTGIAVAQEAEGLLPLTAVAASVSEGADPTALETSLSAVEGVRDVMVVPITADERLLFTPEQAQLFGIPPLAAGSDASAVAVPWWDFTSDVGPAGTESEPASLSEASGIYLAVVITDGTEASIERARTAMVLEPSIDFTPQTRANRVDFGTLTTMHELGTLAYLGMAISIVIAGLSLTVATVAAALERRRTFGLMRLGGMPSRTLRGIIASESAVPLLATMAATVALGFFTAWLIVTGLGNDVSMSWPDVRYPITLALSLVLVAVGMLASFRTVSRSTEVSSTRFE
jgi:hypothetical protein